MRTTDSLVKSIRTREIIEKYKFKFNKGLGQNFLIDEDVLNKIVDAASITKDDDVLEIGPGIGTLTMELAEHAGRVLAIELDDSLIPILNESLRGYENIQIYHGDALKADLKEVASGYIRSPFSICANLPYYITTPLITKFFKEGLNLKNIVLMVQKEVADRMAAGPGGKDYGALSLLVQYYAKPSVIAFVPPHCFIPRPKVDSVVIKLEVYGRPAVDVQDEAMFFRIIRDSFNQRRKTLSNALKPLGISKDKLDRALNNCGIDPTRRGETLSINEFAALADEIYRMTHFSK